MTSMPSPGKTVGARVKLSWAPNRVEVRLVATHTVIMPVSGTFATRVLSIGTMVDVGHGLSSRTGRQVATWSAIPLIPGTRSANRCRYARCQLLTHAPQQLATLLNQLISPAEQRGRHSETQHLR